MAKDWLPDGVEFSSVVQRLRERRIRFGMSVAALAERAGVSRYTLIRIEQGHQCSARTFEKIRRALRMWSDQLHRPLHSEGPFRVQRQSEARWCISIPKGEYQTRAEDDDPIHVDDPAERRRLGELGFQPFFTSVSDTWCVGSRMEQAQMELYQETWVDSHYGDEFVYCLQGSVTITVEDQPCVLEPGDSMSFDARLPHRYAPTEPVTRGSVVPKILFVVVPREGEQVVPTKVDVPKAEA